MLKINKNRVIYYLIKFGRFIPDKLFLSFRYYLTFGKCLNLKNPKSFNEKLQWLKLNNRKILYSDMVDKIKVKNIISDKIGKEHIISTIKVFKNVDEIDFDKLPNQFVLKCNHDSGGICICKDKYTIDFNNVKVNLRKTLNKNYYNLGREWPYKNVKPKILLEELITDESGYELKDYKVFCFNGIPKFIQVDFDRYAASGHRRNLYSTDWELLDFEYGYPSDKTKQIQKPSSLHKVLKFAEEISKGIPFLRVDFYICPQVNADDKILFGEATFFPECGFEVFTPDSMDLFYGDLLNLEPVKKTL